MLKRPGRLKTSRDTNKDIRPIAVEVCRRDTHQSPNSLSLYWNFVESLRVQAQALLAACAGCGALLPVSAVHTYLGQRSRRAPVLLLVACEGPYDVSELLSSIPNGLEPDPCRQPWIGSLCPPPRPARKSVTQLLRTGVFMALLLAARLL